MSYTDDRPRRTGMSLPDGATGLEQRACAAFGQLRDLLCQVLADDTLRPEEREQYEAALREVGDQYRSLRWSVYARYAE